MRRVRLGTGGNRSGQALRRRSGQATLQIAIFGAFLLTVIGTLLRYGQIMNGQQEIGMHSFRQALRQARSEYEAGNFGGASYTSIRHVHSAGGTRPYYDGSQRASVSGGATILWDPKLMKREEGQGPNTYIQLDAEERNLGYLGEEVSILGIETNSQTSFHGGTETYTSSGSKISGSVSTSVTENLTTTIMMDGASDQVVNQSNTFSTNKSW